MKRTAIARRRSRNRKILFSSPLPQSLVKKSCTATTIDTSISTPLKPEYSQAVTPSVTELPSRAFLVEFCYKYWSQWTEEARLEVLRMQQEIMEKATHDQRMTLLNVELLHARLNQVKGLSLYNSIAIAILNLVRRSHELSN